jgi:hypothetical protein
MRGGSGLPAGIVIGILIAIDATCPGGPRDQETETHKDTDEWGAPVWMPVSLSVSSSPSMAANRFGPARPGYRNR